MQRKHLIGSGLAALLISAGAAAMAPDSVEAAETTYEAAPASGNKDQHLARAIGKDLKEARMADLHGVQVEVRDGVVTLTGGVESAREREEAMRIVRRYEGVDRVVDRLSLPARPVSRSDDQLEEEIDRLLDRHAAIDTDRVDVKVRDGAVTLTGMAGTHRDRRLANDIAESVAGVRRVNNEIEVTSRGEPHRSDAEIHREIDGRIDRLGSGRDLDVDVDNGKVELNGSVPSSAILADVLDAVWVPGVREVEDEEVKIDLELARAARREEEGSVSPPERRADRPHELAEEQRAAYRPTDYELERVLYDAFDEEPGFSRFDPVVRVEYGVVYLSGEADSPEMKRRAGQIARDTAGVTKVRNDLRVRGAASADEDLEIDDETLKRRIEEALFEHPFFERNSIEVEVQDGLVRLTGRVGSQREQAAAEDIVRGLAGVRDVRNDLTVSN